MIWVFRELSKMITERTGIPCILPGSVETLQSPHVSFDIVRFGVAHPDPGITQFDEEIAANTDHRADGPSIAKFEINLIMSGFGSGVDFADKYFHDLRELAKVIKPGWVQVPFIRSGRVEGGTGAGLNVTEDLGGMSQEGTLDGVKGVLWASAWACEYVFPTRETEDYVVEDWPAETEA